MVFNNVFVLAIFIIILPYKTSSQSIDEYRYEVHFTENEAENYKYRDAFAIRPNPNVQYTFSYWGEEYPLKLPNKDLIHEIVISYKVPEEIQRVNFYGEEHIWSISIDVVYLDIRNDSDVDIKFRTMRTFDRETSWSSWYVIPSHQSEYVGPFESFRPTRHLQSIQIKYKSGNWYMGWASYTLIGGMGITIK